MTGWTEEELATAAGLKRVGFSNKAIAARLGRTVRAVKARMSKLGAKRRLDGRTGNSGAYSFGRNTLEGIVCREERDAFLGVSSREEE